jgi:phosphate transport system substrate-binding protein
MKISPLQVAGLWLAILALVVPHASAQSVRLHGSTSLAKLVSDRQNALETQIGVKLEVVGNGAGRGLMDLAGGQADIALLAGSLAGVAQAMNAEKPGSVEVTGMTAVPLSAIKLLLVANSAAGVKSLTEAQARDLFSGKITNWKDVGGADVPVKVVLPFPGDGARVSLQEELLNGASFPQGVILRNSSKDIAPVISQLPGALSCVSQQNASGLPTLSCDKDLTMPLLLVAKGEPAGDVKKTVDAIKAALK